MIAHALEFENLATAPVKTTDVQVVRQTLDPYGYHDDLTAYWTSSDLLMTVNIDCVGNFLSTVTKKATIKLLGIVEGIVADETFQIRLGLFINDPSISGFIYLSEGFFLVENVAYDYEAGSTTVILYDHMWRAKETSYSNTTDVTGFTFPATIEDFAGQLASAIGVDLMPGFSSLPNASFVIDADPYANISGATLQSAVQEIAAATGTTARISDATLTFSQYSVNDEDLDSSVLKTLKIGKVYGPVTSVVLGRVPQNDNIVVTNTTPQANIISGINTSTNLITITGHGLVDGNLVRIESDGTMPAPLESGVNYFVYTNGNLNTFALTPTYEDALSGTNIIDLTTSGTGSIMLSHLETQEVQINNNQLLDGDRLDTLPNIYPKLLGIQWNEVKSDTVGLGWHEVGDVIHFTQGSTTIKAFLSEVHLVLNASIQENLVSVIPDVATINYQTAGGVIKTVYDTEIRVDHQENSITSLVSEQTTFENETSTNFTEVYQTIDGVVTQIQSVGGGNLILNSVGYGKETDGTLSFWDQTGSGTVDSYSSAGSLAAGATSGNVIELIGSSVQILQRINVANTSIYSVGFRVNKAAGDGAATLTLSNDVTSFSINLVSANEYVWEELKLENLTPGQNFWDVTLEVSDPTTKIEITDLRVLLGITLSTWQQSQSEILNTQVALTTEGIRVSHNGSQTGDYTVMTPLEFAGYSDVSGSNRKVFTVNRDETIVAKLKAIAGIEYGGNPDNVSQGGVIRAIPIMSGSKAGLAFVGAVS